jgi:hypothetical protein
MKLPQHPLRDTLTKEDWQRIQTAMDTDNLDSITLDEIEAAHDVLYDAIAGAQQTHLGVTTIQ